MTNLNNDIFRRNLSSEVNDYILKSKRKFLSFERLFNDLNELFNPNSIIDIFPQSGKAYNLKEHLNRIAYKNSGNQNYFDIHFHLENYEISLNEGAKNNPGKDDTANISILSDSLIREDDSYLKNLLPKIRETIASDRGFCSATKMLIDLWTELGPDAKENIEAKCIAMKSAYENIAVIKYNFEDHIKSYALLLNNNFLSEKKQHFYYIQNRRSSHKEMLEEKKRQKYLLERYGNDPNVCRWNQYDIDNVLGGIKF